MNDRPKTRKPPGPTAASSDQTGTIDGSSISPSDWHLLVIHGWLAAVSEHESAEHPCVVTGARAVLETRVSLEQIIRDSADDPPPPKFGSFLAGIYEAAGRVILASEPTRGQA